MEEEEDDEEDEEEEEAFFASELFSFFRVAELTSPVCFRSFRFWKALTAFLVPLP